MLKLYLSPITRHAVLTRHALCHLLGFDKFFAAVLMLSMPILNGQNALKNLNKSLNCNKSNLIKQAGFTMLELLVVIALLGVVAIAATTFIIDTGEIQREDATRARWDEIRYAIVGNTSRAVNTSPLVSGYVTDMGRLPTNLDELVAKDYDYDDDGDPDTPNITVTNQLAWNTVQLSGVIAGVTGELSGGWRGPYLYTAGSKFFRDGWENISLDVLGEPDNVGLNNEDSKNYGWSVAVSPVGCAPVDCTDFAVQSLGDNGRVGGKEFSADFPEDALSAVVSANDWQRPADSVSFKVIVNKPPNATQSGLQLRIYFFEDTAITSEESITFTHDTTVSGVTAHTVSIPATVPVTTLPMGKYAAVIICSTASPEVVYDGDCVAPALTMPVYYFTLLPSTSSVDIYWNLP